jgi:hypothetical protein
MSRLLIPIVAAVGMWAAILLPDRSRASPLVGIACAAAMVALLFWRLPMIEGLEPALQTTADIAAASVVVGGVVSLFLHMRRSGGRQAAPGGDAGTSPPASP